jgi:hypothetical protein
MGGKVSKRWGNAGRGNAGRRILLLVFPVLDSALEYSARIMNPLFSWFSSPSVFHDALLASDWYHPLVYRPLASDRSPHKNAGQSLQVLGSTQSVFCCSSGIRVVRRWRTVVVEWDFPKVDPRSLRDANPEWCTRDDPPFFSGPQFLQKRQTGVQNQKWFVAVMASVQ